MTDQAPPPELSPFDAFAHWSWLLVSALLGMVALYVLVEHGSGPMSATMGGVCLAAGLAVGGTTLFLPRAPQPSGAGQRHDWLRVTFKACTVLTLMELVVITNLRAIVSLVTGEPPAPVPAEAPKLSAEDRRELLALVLAVALPAAVGTTIYVRSLYVRYVLRRPEMAWAYHMQGLMNWAALVYFLGFVLMVIRLG